jgi:hypothetical protein
MKNLYFIIGLLIYSVNPYAQDLIVTNKGDSINCKITRQKGDYIYFTFKYENKDVRHTLLDKNQLKYFQYNYFNTPVLGKGDLKVPIKYSRLHIGAFGGYSYRIAKISSDVPDDFQNYARKLKSGYCVGAGLFYYISEIVGFGLDYSLFRSKNQMDNIVVTYNYGITKVGKMSDDISIHYIGPSFSIRLMSKKETSHYLMGMGLGYQALENKSVLIDPFTITGNALGLKIDVGFEHNFNKYFAFDFALTMRTGTLTEISIDDGIRKETYKLDKDQYDNLSRIELTFGLKLTI